MHHSKVRLKSLGAAIVFVVAFAFLLHMAARGEDAAESSHQALPSHPDAIRARLQFILDAPDDGALKGRYLQFYEDLGFQFKLIKGETFGVGCGFTMATPEGRDAPWTIMDPQNRKLTVPPGPGVRFVTRKGLAEQVPDNLAGTVVLLRTSGRSWAVNMDNGKLTPIE